MTTAYILWENNANAPAPPHISCWLRPDPDGNGVQELMIVGRSVIWQGTDAYSVKWEVDAPQGGE